MNPLKWEILGLIHLNHLLAVNTARLLRVCVCVSNLYLLSSTGMKSISKTYSAVGSIPEIRTWNVGNIRLQHMNSHK